MHSLFAERFLLAAVYHAKLPAHPVEIRERKILADTELCTEPVLFAVLRRKHYAVFDRVHRTVDLHLFAIHIDFAALLGIHPEDRPRRLGSARSHQPGKTDDLALVDGKTDIPYHFSGIEIFHFKYLFALLTLHMREFFFDLASDHVCDDLIHRHVGKISAHDILPVAHDSHAVDDVRQLLQAVRYVDDPVPLRFQLADDAEQIVDLPRRQRGRRLVHDQYFCINRKRFCDLDHLLISYGQILYQCFRIYLNI